MQAGWQRWLFSGVPDPVISILLGNKASVKGIASHGAHHTPALFPPSLPCSGSLSPFISTDKANWGDKELALSAGVGWRNKWCGGHSWCCGDGEGEGVRQAPGAQSFVSPCWMRGGEVGGCVCFAFAADTGVAYMRVRWSRSRQKADAFCLGLILISIPAREKV